MSKISCNELINFQDIKNIYLYSKDDFIFCYLKIEPYNTDLLTTAALRSKTNYLTSLQKKEKYLVYFTLPQELDLTEYKNNLKGHYSSEMSSPGNKRTLMEMIKNILLLTNNKENYEHQHYIKIWEKIGKSKPETEKIIKERIYDLEKTYLYVGMDVRVMKENEIIKMCNLASNSSSIDSSELLDVDKLFELPIHLI